MSWAGTNRYYWESHRRTFHFPRCNEARMLDRAGSPQWPENQLPIRQHCSSRRPDLTDYPTMVGHTSGRVWDLALCDRTCAAPVH